MESFCGSPFWDANHTLITDIPTFTPCFEKTLLVWIPSAFLSLFSAVQIYFTLKLHQGKIPTLILGSLQGGFTFILLIIQIIDVSFTVRKLNHSRIKLYPVDQAQPIIKAVTFALALFLQVLTKRKGIQSSVVLFFFWLLLTICSLPEFVRELRNLPLQYEWNNHQTIHTIATLVGYPAIVFEFILNFFADRVPVLLQQGWNPKTAKQAESEEIRPCPQKSSSIVNQWTFQWMYPLLWKGYRRALEFSDLWDLNEEDKSYVVTQRFIKYWKLELERVKKWNAATKNSKNDTPSINNKNGKVARKKLVKNKKTASVLPALWKANWRSIVISGILLLVQCLLGFISPLILGLLISHLESDNAEESRKGYFYVGILFLNGIVMSLMYNYHTYLILLTGRHFRTTLTEVIYQKSLVVSNKSRKESTVGEIVNLMSVDTQMFRDVMQYSHQLWNCPLKIVLALYFLWGYLGPATISGIVFLVILIPVSAKITKMKRNLRLEQMKKKDERIRLTNEILLGIKALKLYAWEPYFEERVGMIRQIELDIIRRIARIDALANFFSFMTPVLISIASFVTFVLMDNANILDAQIIFVSLTLFNIMRMPLESLQLTVGRLVQTQVSLNRINRFMNADEINPEDVSHNYPQHDNLVSITDGTFTWGEKIKTLTLRNIKLNVKKGSLIAVIGNVGSGKSSLLSAILGEMEIQSGRINTWGSIAYLAQQAWIQNATLRENILFGREFDPVLYDRVIEACALKPDIKILPGGDQTEIGEKGINLSGGQKQRVALARAVYNDTDIYLLDDPLSAVDPHVGKHLFQKVIGPEGVLYKKTRIVVTHGIAYLPHVDHIVVMKNGEIAEYGNYEELLKSKEGLTNIFSEVNSEEDVDIGYSNFEPRVETSSTGEDIKANIENISEGDTETIPSKLIGAERATIGNIKMDVYTQLMKAMGFSFVMVSAVAFTLGYGANIYSNFWLLKWSKIPAISGTQDMEERNTYLAVYCVLGIIQSISMYLANITMLLGVLNAAARFHESMLSRILRAPMSFFDTTPSGRILNRFSQDIDVPDTDIGFTFFQLISALYEVLSTLIVISINMPLFLALVVPISCFYIGAQRFYAATSRQLRRLESISRSSIFSHFSETLAGLPTIRAFKVQPQFLAALEKHLDKNNIAAFLSLCTKRWITITLECTGNFVVLFVVLYSLWYRSDGGSTGLSITYAFSFAMYLNFLIKQTIEAETAIVSIERIKEYCEIPQEAPWLMSSQKPAIDWPQDGNIIFNNLQLRYREDLDLVLRGVTCNISPGEKVGIVGRTGAGKSSFTLALFRILEAAGGTILIDGENIFKMGLQDIRGRLTIIPQDPVLFVGSVRFNLDPSGKQSDDILWNALEQAHLKDYVVSLPEGLNATVQESGKNFSVGQMQLVCLARALLRNTKILILDEATAAVDLHTDDLIQRTIRTEFRDCTILTIAHRLNTIMDSDRVMVLEKGVICEFDSPENLLSNQGSIFSSMAKEAGLL